jgi:hypothetical protein
MWLSQFSEGLVNAFKSDVDGVLEKLSNEPFNGRQIRSIVTSAQAITRARSIFANTTFANTHQVTKMTKNFQVYFNHSSELTRQRMLRRFFKRWDCYSRDV